MKYGIGNGKYALQRRTHQTHIHRLNVVGGVANLSTWDWRLLVYRIALFAAGYDFFLLRTSFSFCLFNGPACALDQKAEHITYTLHTDQSKIDSFIDSASRKTFYHFKQKAIHSIWSLRLIHVSNHIHVFFIWINKPLDTYLQWQCDDRMNENHYDVISYLSFRLLTRHSLTDAIKKDYCQNENNNQVQQKPIVVSEWYQIEKKTEYFYFAFDFLYACIVSFHLESNFVEVGGA